MTCTWDDWWFFGFNDLGGSLVSWTSDVKAVWVDLKGDRKRHSQWPCSSNPGKPVLEPILPRGEIKCSAGFSTSQAAVITPWKQLRRKGVYLALSSRVQFPGRESWLQGLLEADHDASQIRKQRTGFLFIHSRVQTSGTVALTSRAYLLTSINLKQSPSAMLKACYLGNSRSHPVVGHDHL